MIVTSQPHKLFRVRVRLQDDQKDLWGTGEHMMRLTSILARSKVDPIWVFAGSMSEIQVGMFTAYEVQVKLQQFAERSNKTAACSPRVIHSREKKRLTDVEAGK